MKSPTKKRVVKIYVVCYRQDHHHDRVWFGATLNREKAEKWNKKIDGIMYTIKETFSLPAKSPRK